MDDDERRLARPLATKGDTVVGVPLTPFDPAPRYLVRFAPAVAHAGHGANVWGPDTFPELERLIDARPPVQGAG